MLRLGWGGERGMVYFFASQPVAADRCAGYVVIGRNYNLDQPDQVIHEFEDTIFGQDQVVVESQRPERVPFDLAAELHLKFDAVAVAYRKAMRSSACRGYSDLTVTDPALTEPAAAAPALTDPAAGGAAVARVMWTLFEPVHAVTYFAPEARSAFEDAGLRGVLAGIFRRPRRAAGPGRRGGRRGLVLQLLPRHGRPRGPRGLGADRARRGAADPPGRGGQRAAPAARAWTPR